MDGVNDCDSDCRFEYQCLQWQQTLWRVSCTINICWLSSWLPLITCPVLFCMFCLVSPICSLRCSLAADREQSSVSGHRVASMLPVQRQSWAMRPAAVWMLTLALSLALQVTKQPHTVTRQHTLSIDHSRHIHIQDVQWNEIKRLKRTI